MSNNIKIFKNTVFGEIRTMTNEKGETFFVGKDVAKALGYAKSRNALATHVDADDKKDALIQGPLGGTQKMTVINESGLYTHSLFEVGTGEGVQALGDKRGAATDSHDGRLYPHEGCTRATAL